MLEEVTADFEFNPPASSAEEPQQQTQKETQSKKQQKQPKKVTQIKKKQKASKNKQPKQPKRTLPPREARTQAAEQITKQLTKTAKPKSIDVPLKEGSCGATSKQSRFSKHGRRTPSPHQSNSPSWRQRSHSMSPGPSNTNVRPTRAMLYHKSVSPQNSMQQQRGNPSPKQFRSNVNQPMQSQ